MHLRQAARIRRLIRGALALLLASTCATATRADFPGWFPTQRTPATLIRFGPAPPSAEPPLAYDMLVQSVAGLAAKAVNEQRGEELVWVETGNADLQRWFDDLVGKTPAMQHTSLRDPWELVEHFRRRGLIQGFILYRLDRSAGEVNEYREGMDCSVNIATSLAGLLNGVLIDESLADEARRRGLQQLIDVREQTQAWCFETYKHRFNKRMLCAQDPRKPHVRDFAIAHHALTMYGPAVNEEVMRFLEPLSPVVGWNGGDEFQTTRLSTIHGHIQTATDWCMNLPVLMAGAQNRKFETPAAFDPHSIDWSDRRSAVSFVCSDGDNVQWLQGSFFGNSSYWANPDRGRIPFGWSGCFAHLCQFCPSAIDYAWESRKPNDSWIEWGGGYYYPDLFALERPQRWESLTEHAHSTWQLMQRTGTLIIGFNVWRPASPDALRAYQTFAQQTEGLLAMFVFQYAPYEGGAGQVFWVKDRAGVDVPVVTARYSIWEHVNRRPRAGTPARVAHEIAATVAAATEAAPRYDWVIDHAWSHFRPSPNDDDDAENLTSPDQEGQRGYSPVMWCAQRLPDTIRVVRPEELAWRIRMQHDPGVTRALIDRNLP
ncbi:MAG: GxGYxYP family putative glycoside hydrolase [Planctomycetaceae bacterium]